jgi:sugar lactone lactonase YvrE
MNATRTDAAVRAFSLAAVALLGAVGCDDSDLPGGPAADCLPSPGNICTVAGTGVAGDGVDGQPPLATMLYAPADVAFTPDGRLVVVDWNNHRIRALQGDGTLKIVAGVGELGNGLLVDEVTGRLNHPTDVIFDPQGRMIVAAWHNSRIKRVDLVTGVIEDIVGTGARSFGGDNGPAAKCDLNLPAGIVLDPAGNLFISDQANQRIRRVDPAGTIITVAGAGSMNDRGFAGDGGPALKAKFNLPIGQQGHPAAHIAMDSAGALVLADTLNNRIRRIGPDGIVSTVAGKGTFGGNGAEGPALEAELAAPVDVAFGPDGALYIADTENNCVRRVQDGLISTVAGTCGACGGGRNDGCRCPATDAACIGDGGSARAASLKRPTGIAFDGNGNLYIADTLNHRVRVVYR